MTRSMVIKKVGVLGLGVQGQGIVEVSAKAGFEVFAVERNDELIKRGQGLVKESMTKAIKKGRLTEADMNKAWAISTGPSDPRTWRTAIL